MAIDAARMLQDGRDLIEGSGALILRLALAECLGTEKRAETQTDNRRKGQETKALKHISHLQVV
jgi:hypothetical protein